MNFLFIVLFSLPLNLFAGSGGPFKLNLNNLDELDGSILFSDQIYITGNISPLPDSILFNGEKALLNANGGFIANFNLIFENRHKVNNFNFGKIIAELFKEDTSFTIVNYVGVMITSNNFPDNKIVIDTLWNIRPKGGYLMHPGESIPVEFRATPGCEAWLTVEGDSNRIFLDESSKPRDYYWGKAVFGNGLNLIAADTIRGIYSGNIVVPNITGSAKYKLHLRKLNFSGFNETLKANITVLGKGESITAVTKEDPNLITGRYGPGKGYKLFMDEGIELEALSIENDWLKCSLGDGGYVYIPKASADIKFNKGKVEPAEIQVIRGEDNKNIEFIFGFSKRTPVEIIQSLNPSAFRLLFYNVTANIDWVKYDKTLKWVESVEHRQIDNSTLEVSVKLRTKSLWGYSARYEGNNFILEIKKPPAKRAGFIFSANQLNGRTIVIDPGHSPESGAVGPLGLKEKDINFVLSYKLKSSLEENGAKVFLTRSEKQSLPLRERRQRVISFNPDIAISMHNNAVPQSVNPLKHNGFSVYYYYPQSMPLAKIIHSEFRENLPIPDFGLYWDNLYMCRITETVSLLLEPAFIIHPAQEEMLKSEEFQETIVNSIVESLKEYFEEFAE